MPPNGRGRDKGDVRKRGWSLRGRLLILWAISLVSAVAVGTVLVELYRQSSIDRMARAEAVVGIQLLDGVAAGIFGVVSVVIAADLTRGTGRFNLAQGLVALCTGVGAALSNIVAGYVVQFFGFSAGFLFLAALAGGALVFFWVFMPETETAEAGAAPGAAAQATA